MAATEFIAEATAISDEISRLNSRPLSSYDIDRAGPSEVAVFLHQADVEGIVATVDEGHFALDVDVMVRIRIGHAKHADAALDPAGVEHPIVEPDVGHLDLGLDQRGVDPQGPCVRIVEPGEAAGRERRPLELGWTDLLEPAVEVPEIDR